MQDPESVVIEEQSRVGSLIDLEAVDPVGTEVPNHLAFSVPLSEEGRADLWGGTPVARLTLGGTVNLEENIPSQTVEFLQVRWTEDANYQALVKQAVQENKRSSKLVVLALDEKGRPSAAAFMSPKATYTLGREGTLSWFRIGGSGITPEGWTPFNENHSISRKQVTLYYDDKSLGIFGQSENSKTVLRAARKKEFKQVHAQS